MNGKLKSFDETCIMMSMMMNMEMSPRAWAALEFTA